MSGASMMTGSPAAVAVTPGLGYLLLKRGADVAVAGLLLALVSPLLLLVAVAIKLDSRGPVFFRQDRMGARVRWRGHEARFEPRPFRMIKFRSMSSDADDGAHRRHIAALAAAADDAPSRADSIKLRDARVTPVGQILRKLSVDELPQLFNVLRGEMSLVGPRPLPLYEAELLGRLAPERFLALPGMTGLWQISGRCALPFEEMQRLDLEYVARRSTLLDVKIIALTPLAVFSMKGAG